MLLLHWECNTKEYQYNIITKNVLLFRCITEYMYKYQHDITIQQQHYKSIV